MAFDKQPGLFEKPKPVSETCSAPAVLHHSTCPVCGGKAVPWRAKLICEQCRTVVLTCCD